MKVIIAILLCSMCFASRVDASLQHKASSLTGKMAVGIGKATKLAVVGAMCLNLLSCELDREREQLSNIITPSAELEASFPIMQGVTTYDQTQVFVQTDTSGVYSFSLLDGGGKQILPASIDRSDYREDFPTIHKLLFSELTSNTKYLLQVRNTISRELLDERVLSTLDPSRGNLRFAFGSCMVDFLETGEIWRHMVALNPDVIFLIGDNVYADFPVEQTDPSILWERNFQTRERLGLFRSKQLVPVVATWDDHDFGMNNAGSEYPYKMQSLTVFKTFFASDASDNFSMPGIGVASLFNIYGFNFFLLDNRTFLTPVGETPEWHFGEAQSQWLFDNLIGKDHAFLVSGDQFFGGYSPKDSFQGHRPQRFSEFLKEIKAIDTKVVFLSGDRHFTEIMEIPADRVGYTTYELTSSPIQQLPKSFLFPNPLRIEGQDMMNNFMLVEVSEDGGGMHLYATSYAENGKAIFKRKLNIK